MVLALGQPAQKEPFSGLPTGAKAHVIGVGDADWEAVRGIRPGEPVLIKGLGLTFFDYVTLLTQGRGGEFRELDGELRYVPSGKEPCITAFSRSGAPLSARGRNQKRPDERWEPRFLTPEEISRHHAGGSQLFSSAVWPQLVKEVELCYALTSARNRGVVFDESLAIGLLNESFEDFRGYCHSIGVETTFPWRRLVMPLASFERAERDGNQVLMAYLEDDLRRANRGNVDEPFKAACDVFRDVRNEVRDAVHWGGINRWSFEKELNSKYTKIATYASVGPPAKRVAELIALLKSGVVTILDPDPFVAYDAIREEFEATPVSSTAAATRASCFIDARIGKCRPRFMDDELIRSLVDDHERGVQFVRENGEPVGFQVEGTDARYRLATDGAFGAGVYAYGAMLEGTQWGTGATMRPYVNSAIFDDAEGIATDIVERISNE